MGTPRAEKASAKDAIALWRAYKETGDQRLRDRLVLTYAPMVKYIVYRKLRGMPVGSDLDDFISAGLEALIQSIDRFDPDKGASLEQFAWTRVHGAVLDELRRGDWAPRSVRRFDRELGRARDRLIAQTGRQPTRTELSAAVGVQPHDIARHEAEVARSQIASLNATVSGPDESGAWVERLSSDDPETDPEAAAVTSAGKARFRAAFEQLPERERKVAVLLYVHNLKLHEIGEILGVTESRVCQLHAQILKTLRTKLARDEQLFSFAA